MSYLEKVLQPDEKIVYQAKVHWVVYLPPFIWLAYGMPYLAFGMSERSVGMVKADPSLIVWGLVFEVLGLTLWIRAWITRNFTELAVTTLRVVAKIGFIRRHTWEVNNAKVEGVRVKQSVLGRILGYGTVTVRGTGIGIAPIRKVDDPLEFRKHVVAR